VIARKPVHVLVGLIADASGRWLVNRRPAGTPLEDFWEFPGGKRLPNEPRATALSRELDEELGIEVVTAEPWLEVVHDYPEKRVLLDVWRVLEYRGVVTAREGQPLAWVATDDLAALPLLAADAPIIEALQARAESAATRAQTAGEGISRAPAGSERPG
jgi:8-oxo-dGTP diphosphatase